MDREDTGSSSPSNGNGDFVHVEKVNLCLEYLVFYSNLYLQEECLTEDSGEINWDIETVEEPFEGSNASDPADSPLLLSRSTRDSEFLTVLEHNITRNNFINELHEVL